MKRALILLAPGFEETEAVTVIDLLRRAEIDVTVAGLHNRSVKGSHDITIESDGLFNDIAEDVFDVFILPGGQPGTDNLKASDRVLKWIVKRSENGRLTAAICAAPVVLHAAGITGGLKLTSYPSEEKTFTDARYKTDDVVRDGSVLTSRGLGTAISFSLEIISELVGAETASVIAERILYQSLRK